MRTGRQFKFEFPAIFGARERGRRCIPTVQCAGKGDGRGSREFALEPDPLDVGPQDGDVQGTGSEVHPQLPHGELRPADEGDCGAFRSGSRRNGHRATIKHHRIGHRPVRCEVRDQQSGRVGRQHHGQDGVPGSQRVVGRSKGRATRGKSRDAGDQEGGQSAHEANEMRNGRPRPSVQRVTRNRANSRFQRAVGRGDRKIPGAPRSTKSQTISRRAEGSLQTTPPG